MNESETVAILALLSSVYADFTVDDDVKRTWASLFADMPFALVERSVTALVRTRSTCPSIAAIRKHVVEQSLALPSADDAWANVRDVVSARQRLVTPSAWLHPLVAHIARNLGLTQLVESTNVASDRARFIDAYDVATARERERMTADFTQQPFIALRPSGCVSDASYDLVDDLLRIARLPEPPPSVLDVERELALRE